MIPPILLNILVNLGIFMIITLSLNLEVGFGGIPQFGRVLAVITGAYVTAGLVGRIVALIGGQALVEMVGGNPAGLKYTDHMYNFKIVDYVTRNLMVKPHIAIATFLLAIALSAIFGGIIGWLCSYPALRLKEAYLGITLLAFGDLLLVIGWNYDPIVGGTEGVMVPDVFAWAGDLRFEVSTAAILIVAVLAYIYLEKLAKSPFGRALKAMRDDEVASRVYGKDIVKLRAQALITGSAIAAIGGALWALQAGSVKAVTYTRLTWTFWPWAFMMLGGTGNNTGIIVGVLLFTIVRTIIFGYKSYLKPYVPFDPVWLEYLFIGIVIMIIPLIRPKGLIPERPELTLPKKRIASILERIKKEKE